MDKELENKIRKEIRSILLESIFEKNDDSIEKETCVTCNGSGKVNGKTCHRCGGKGELPKNVEDIFHQIADDKELEELEEKEERGKMRPKKVKPPLKPKKTLKINKKAKPIKPLKPIKPKLHSQNI